MDIEQEIAVADIVVRPGRRAMDSATVDRLAESINVRGLENAIKVARGEDGSGPPYTLVYGAHRKGAHEKLGRLTIRAKITAHDPLLNEYDEIIDNLLRNDLSAPERVDLTRRHALLLDEMEERTSPVLVTQPVSPKKQGGRAGVHGSDSKSVRAQAEKTGENRESVRRNRVRGEALKEELPDLLKTTMSGEAMDALVKMKASNPEKVPVIIARAQAGEKFTAKSIEAAMEEPDDEPGPPPVLNNMQKAKLRTRCKNQIRALASWLHANQDNRGDKSVGAAWPHVDDAVNAAYKERKAVDLADFMSKK